MHKLEPNNKIYLHGIAINRISRTDAERFIASKLEKKCNDLPVAVFTPNAEIVFRATHNEELTRLLNSGDLNVPDGVGVIWASKKLGNPLPERIPGIELGEYTIALAAEHGYRVFLLGGTEGTAEQAAKKLSEKYPSLSVCGIHHGYFSPDSEENEKLIKLITESSPDIVAVCLGFPRQERWIMNNRHRLPDVKIMMALGGSLDVWSQKIRRAPKTIQYLRIEWLWRILREPTRLSRATALPAFVGITLRASRLKKRKLKAKLS